MNSERDSIGGKQVSNKAALIGLVIFAGIAVAIILFFALGNLGDSDPEPVDTPTAQTQPEIVDPPATQAPAATSAPTSAEQGPPEGSANNASSNSEPNLPSYVNGVPYSESPNAMKKWGPIRAEFIRALISSGDQAEAAGDSATESVIQDLEALEPGQYHGTEFEDALDGNFVKSEIEAEPFEYTERFSIKGGGSLSVTISYEENSDGKGKWLVTNYSMSDS